MTERILGPTGSPRRRRWLGVPILLVVLVGLFWIAGAQAVHDTGRFQLDGDAATGTNTAGTPTASDDWDKVCFEVARKPVAQGGGGLSVADATTKCGIGTGTTGPATETSWVEEPNLNSNIFTGGGSKDPQDVNQWAWKDGAGGLPDKDNLLHGFAARYSLTPDATHCPAGTFATCELLFFGLDRLDNSGDAQSGFWFFQQPIGFGSNAVGGGTGFTGVHTPGDVLVVSDFSNGGGTATITVYTWDPNCTATNKPAAFCADANLHTQATSSNAKCSALPPGSDTGDRFCGIVNPSTITMPWAFTDKSGTPNRGALNGEFYEAGINLSALGLADQCFSSVLAESRSSTSTTATLKDFILGQLGSCDTTLVTTPKLADGTTNVPAGGASIGTGSVQVRDSADLNVQGVSTWAGTMKFFLCGPMANATDTCATGGTQMGLTQNLTQASTNPVLSEVTTVTSAGRFCWRAEFDATTNGVPDKNDGSSGECFTVNPVTPTLTTQASGTVALGQPISDTATITGTATQPTGPPPYNTTGTTGAAAGGKITFTAYGPDSCSTVAFGPTDVTISGDGTYGGPGSTPAISFTPTAAGQYVWVASYNGNSPNTNGVPATACANQPSAEKVIVNSSSTVTTPHDGSSVPISGALSIGTGSVTVRDKAVVTGSGNTTDPTGNVKFFLCGPIATGNCATGGTQIGSPAAGEALVPGTLNDSISSVFSDIVTVTSAGRYCFRAEYQGDSLYPASSDPTSSSDTSTTECFTVNPVTPTLTTQASANTSLGQPISDTATISGTASQPTGPPPFNTTGTTGAPAGGTITWNVYGPDSCVTLAAGPFTRTISGDGTYPTAAQSPVSFTPTLPGLYVWVASYGGNLPNTNAVPAIDCTQQPNAEKVTVTQTQITTSPSAYPNDSATISVANGAAPTGNVVFSLYNTLGNCQTGGATGRLFTETVALPATNVLSKSVNTHNGDPSDQVTDYSHTDLAATTLYWRVTYGGDGNHQGRNSICQESTAIDHTADSSGGTAP